MVFTSVLFVLPKCFAILRFGLVRLAGQYFTCLVSSVGLRMRDQPSNNSQTKKERYRQRGGGDVLVVTCRKTICPQHTPVGALTRLTLNRFLAFHHTLAVKRVASSERLKSVHIHAIYSAMQGHVPLVLIPVQKHPVTAARQLSREGA